MKNKVIFLMSVLFSVTLVVQVGINTSIPRATLDITAKTPKGNSTGPEGLLLPRVDREKAQSMVNVDPSTIIYVNDITTGTATGSAINIDRNGFYYFDNNFWNKMNISGDNIYTTDGTLSSNRTVTQNSSRIGFTASSVNAFSIDLNTFSVDAANNRIGIGTVAPTNELQVVGNEFRLGGPLGQLGTVANPTLRIHSNANQDGSGGSIVFSENAVNFGYYIRHNSEGGNSFGKDGLAIGASQTKYPTNYARPGFFIADDQNVGFGTATPQSMLHIDGARDNNINGTPNSSQESNDIVVNTSGNVGVGTISPIAKLHLISSGLDAAVFEQANRSVTSGGPYLALRKNQSDDSAANGAVTAGASIGAITFDGNTGNGYVGVGIAGKSSIAAYAAENFTATAKGSFLAFNTVPVGTINSSRRMTIGSDGRVGIGRVATTNILEVQGDASKSTAGSWVTNSDERLKKNIQQIPSTEALNKLLKLKGVYFFWDDNKTGIGRPQGRQVGFTAQNIQETFPDKVTTDDKGFLQTAYGDYDPIIVEAIRELNFKINKLEKENDVLKKEIERISK